MAPRTSTLLISVFGAMTTGGAVVSVVYFFQPWRSCSYEDTSAGCAMLPQDAVVMSVAMLVTVIAFLVLSLSTAARLVSHSAASGGTADPSARRP